MKPQLKYPFFLALDIEDPVLAWRFLQEHKLSIGGVKLGPKLILKAGWNFVEKAAQLAPVFLDFKFYDIPSITLSAVKESFSLGASFVSVHVSVGAKALALLANFEVEANKTRPFKVLPVSILTSFAEQEQLPHWKEGTIIEKIKILANLVRESGLSSLVCSPGELKILKALYPDFFFVTPGVRLNKEGQGLVADDQQRVLTPLEALSAGSSALVIGRPIYNSLTPQKVLDSIILSCKN